MKSRRPYLAAIVILCLLLTIGSRAEGGAETPSRRRACPQVSPCPPAPVARLTSADAIAGARERIIRLRQRLEEWGVVSMSAPVVMRVEEQFLLEDKDGNFPTPKEYITYEQNNVSGASAQLTETGFTSQTSAQVTPALPAPAPGETPNPASDSSKLPTPPLNITNTLSSDRPAAAGGLIGSGLAALTRNPGRSAVLQGVNNKLTEKILATMANPPYAKFSNPDYDVYFAIVQVSCNPGWRTRVNYVADLSATCEYYDSRCKRLAPPNREGQPLIFSVLPLIDAQTLELSNGERQLTALAAQVNAAYPTIGLSILGQELISFVRRSQRDVLTRTPITVSNSYASGHTFGFRMAPSLTAQRDPAARRSGAANVLQATSFPVLVTVVVNRNDFGDKYDSIITHVAHRWIISERPPLPQWYRRLTLPLRREGVDRRLEMARDLAGLRCTLNQAFPEGSGYPPQNPDPDLVTLRDEVLDLEAKCGEHDQVFRIFSTDNKYPKITYWEPNPVPAEGAFSLVVHGTNLRGATQVLLGARAGTKPVVKPDGRTLVATFSGGDKLPTDRKVQLVVITNRGRFASRLTDATGVVAPAPPPENTRDEIEREIIKNTVTVAVEREAKDGGPVRIQLDRRKFKGVSDDKLLESLTRVLEQAVQPSAAKEHDGDGPKPSPTPGGR